MNCLEVINVLIVILGLTMLFHSWNVYGHELFGLDLLIEEFMYVFLTLTLNLAILSLFVYLLLFWIIEVCM